MVISLQVRFACRLVLQPQSSAFCSKLNISLQYCGSVMCCIMCSEVPRSVTTHASQRSPICCSSSAPGSCAHEHLKPFTSLQLTSLEFTSPCQSQELCQSHIPCQLLPGQVSLTKTCPVGKSPTRYAGSSSGVLRQTRAVPSLNHVTSAQQ